MSVLVVDDDVDDDEDSLATREVMDHMPVIDGNGTRRRTMDGIDGESFVAATVEGKNRGGALSLVRRIDGCLRS